MNEPQTTTHIVRIFKGMDCLICGDRYQIVAYQFVTNPDGNTEDIENEDSGDDYYFGERLFVCTDCAVSEDDAKSLLNLGASYNKL